MRIKNIVALALAGSSLSACHAQSTANPTIARIDSFYSWRKASADGTGKFYMGREIAHVMVAGGGNWLERDNRQEEENVQLAMDNIKLAPNAVVADVGAGTGYFSFKLSGKVPKGKVYAVEIQDELISYLNNKKKSLQDSVVKVIKGSDHSPNLPANSVDLVIMVDVYHELAYPHEMLQSIRSALKPAGKILFIEYRGEDPAVQIKPLHKTTVAQLNRELKANGFTLHSRGEFLPIQHFLLYEKK